MTIATTAPRLLINPEEEELLLFGDLDKKKIEKRKKYFEDLWRERKPLRCEGAARSGEV